jgi:hypothetical protein
MLSACTVQCAQALAGHAWDDSRGLLTWQVCAFDMAHWCLPLLGVARDCAGGEVKRRSPPTAWGGEWCRRQEPPATSSSSSSQRGASVPALVQTEA